MMNKPVIEHPASDMLFLRASSNCSGENMQRFAPGHGEKLSVKYKQRRKEIELKGVPKKMQQYKNLICCIFMVR